MSERVPCERCGQPMFHLAQTCPHCGVRRGGAAPEAEARPRPARPALSLSPEEARALLAVQAPGAGGPATLVHVARDLVLPRAGALEWVTSLLSGPLTVASIVALALARLRERRARREESLQGAALLAVPATAGLVAVALWELDAATGSWGVLGACFAAWAVRAVVRARVDDGLR